MNEQRLLGYYTIFLLLSSLVRSFMLRDSHGCMPWTLDYFQKKDGTGELASRCVSFPKILIFRQKSELFFCKQPKHILMHLPCVSFYHDIHSDSTQPFSQYSMYIGRRVAGELGFFQIYDAGSLESSVCVICFSKSQQLSRTFTRHFCLIDLVSNVYLPVKKSD